MITRIYNVLQLFAGIGGGCLGFSRAEIEYRGVRARFRTIGAVDVDAGACKALERLVGCKATVLDLFTREQYEDYHGKPPPPGWREITPADLRAACGELQPNVVFASPPCKGLSRLLANAKSKTRKYQALNQLVSRWLFLVLEAWPEHPPELLIFENVPGIRQRGLDLLNTNRGLLRAYNYAIDERVHDCGLLGGLAQTRRRYLLVARHLGSCTSLLYEPVHFPLQPISAVLATLPPPDAPEAGPLHVLPNLEWRTLERLALIPAGGDWRDLAKVWRADRWRIVPTSERGPGNRPVFLLVDGDAVSPGAEGGAGIDEGVTDLGRGSRFNDVYRVVDWQERSPAVTGGTGPSSGGLSVADPRTGDAQWNRGVLGVQELTAPSCTVTGNARASTGAFSVADPRLTGNLGSSSMTLRVRPADAPSPPVTGRSNVWDSGGFAVADPVDGARFGAHHGKLRVEDAAGPAHTVTGSDRVGSGALSVADPGVTSKRWPGAGYAVQASAGPSRTVTGTVDVQSGALCVADPGLSNKPRNGTMGVMRWDTPSFTITGSGDVHAGGASAIADPRPGGELGADAAADAGDDVGGLPAPEAGAMILSPDGTWHRPLTTRELASLQGFPLTVNGDPFWLPGRSTAKWREWIGNAVPPGSAQAVAEQMLATLVSNELFGGVHHGNTGFWVREAGVLTWHQRAEIERDLITESRA